jgi:hypothetical protein
MIKTSGIKFNIDIEKIINENIELFNNMNSLINNYKSSINEINNRNYYNLHQLYNYSEEIKPKIKNLNYPFNIIDYNKQLLNYNLYTVYADCKNQEINYYTTMELKQVGENILEIIIPIFNTIRRKIKEINDSYDISLSYEDRIKWKEYVKPVKSQFTYIQDIRNYYIEHIKYIEEFIAKYAAEFVRLDNEMYDWVNPPSFIPIK